MSLKSNFDALNESLQVFKTCINDSNKSALNFNKDIKKFNVENNSCVPEFVVMPIINNYITKYKTLIDKIKQIRKKINDDVIKIFLFGKVSAGKSTFINAILGTDIFYSAASHTTSCIVKITQSQNNIHSINYKNGNKNYESISSLKEEIRKLSTNFSEDSNKLNFNESLCVYLNMPNNNILREKVEIYDCPGSFQYDNVTSHVKKESLKANIFIFIIEHFLSKEEEEFFHYISTQSTKPIIFVIINKWDQTLKDDAEMTQQSKVKITNQLKTYLIDKNELSIDEVKSRIFFVSSSQILKSRMDTKFPIDNNPIDVNKINEEFISFENALSKFMDNFLENKSEIYEKDKLETRNEIIKTLNEFRKEINKLKLDTIGKNRKVMEVNKSINKSKENLEYQFTEDTKELYNMTSAKFDNYKSKLNREKMDSVEIEIKELQEHIENRLLKIEKKINETIETEIRQFENLTGARKDKEKCDLKGILNKEIMLQKINQNFWKRFCDFFLKVFSTQKNYEKHVMVETNNVLENYHKELNNDIKENQEILQQKINSEFSNMDKIMKFQIQCFNDFWKSIDNIMANLEM